jgi:hypothetical protein
MKSFKQYFKENINKDIVVTIPKSEYKNDDLETQRMNYHNENQFWTMKKIPKAIGIGSRIYFVKHGMIESSMKIFKIERDKEETCTTTGRLWKGNLLYMNDLQYLDNTIPCKGFQGYRYRWW